jgi:hypothetical protein
MEQITRVLDLNGSAIADMSLEELHIILKDCADHVYLAVEEIPIRIPGARVLINPHHQYQENMLLFNIRHCNNTKHPACVAEDVFLGGQAVNVSTENTLP